MTAPQTPVGSRGRAPILIVVMAALVAGFFAGRSELPRASRTVAPVDATQRSNLGALTTAWYCPGLPETFPTWYQTITLSNLGSDDAQAVVTIHPDNGSDPIVRRVTVPAETVRSFDRGTLLETTRAALAGTTGTGAPAGNASGKTTGKAAKRAPGHLPPGPVVVEPFSPDIVVSAGIETNTALDVVPCATSASNHWYFAAGETVRGVKQWLVLDDPFSSDARVDITLRTDSGLQLLPALQGVDVPGRSRVVIPIQDSAVRQPRVAVEVHAVVGQVVASQTLEYDVASGTPGIATALGALAPSSHWWFTDGVTLAGASQWVAVTDIGPIQANFDVQAFIGGNAILSPVVARVDSGGVVWVQIGGCAKGSTSCLQVPANTGYELEVSADGGVPIVAQTLSRFTTSQTALGASTSIGSTVPARRWVIARTRASTERSTSISVMNPNLGAAHVSVDIVHDGVVDRPDDVQHLALAPSARLVLPAETGGASRQHDAAVVITADAPIYAESTIYTAHDVTRSAGIPTR